jgi:RNA-binding protein
MQLTDSQNKKLRGLGHLLKPVVTIGSSGLTESVLKEFTLSLNHHELMKVRVNAGDRDERDRLLKRICEDTGALLLQRVGNIGLFLKLRKKNSTLLSKL